MIAMLTTRCMVKNILDVIDTRIVKLYWFHLPKADFLEGQDGYFQNDHLFYHCWISISGNSKKRVIIVEYFRSQNVIQPNFCLIRNVQRLMDIQSTCLKLFLCLQCSLSPLFSLLWYSGKAQNTYKLFIK